MKLFSLLLVAGAVWFRAAAETVVATPETPVWPVPLAPLASTPPPLPGPDRDGDGLSDLQELRMGTDPTKADTDGDGFSDGQEYNLRTDPLSGPKTPLFLLSTNAHRLLLGDTLIIRPSLLTNFIVITNIDITNIPPVYEGTPIDTDDDGTPDSCDADGDGVADTAELCPITTPGSTKTNITVITNFIQFQWFAGTTPLPTQTNATLVLLNAGAADSAAYHLEALLLLSTQTSDDVPVTVLPLTPQLQLPPAGKVLSWGGNISFQTNVPADMTNVIQVAGGFLHSVALRADGSVAAWGDGGLRQTDVPRDAFGIAAIATGASHVLALRTNGTVMGWGANQYGQATPPPGLSNVVAISAGYFHSVALRSDGTVVCWGDNAFGQTNQHGLPAVVKIAAGMLHTVALRADGSIVCWGDDTFGQCNTSGVEDLLTDIVAIAAGGKHSVALRRDGIVVTWGAGASVPADLPKAIEIGAGYNLTGAVTHDRKLVLWGDTTVTTAPTASRPTGLNGGFYHGLLIDALPDSDGDLLDDRYEEANRTGVTQADSDRDGLNDGVEVRGGSDPTKADTDGDGLLDLFELGHGFPPTIATETVPGSLKALPALELEFFSSGRTVFALQSSPDGMTWSNAVTDFVPRRGISRLLTNVVAEANHYRLLPTGTTTGNPSPESGPPEPVVVGTIRAFGNGDLGQLEFSPLLGNVVRVAAGVWHTVGLKGDGSVIAWGLNSAGQCEVPAELGEAIAIAGGGLHSLAVRPTGEVVGWGSNAYGQLNVPNLVAPATAVAAGGSHSLALLNDGTVVAWGANEAGEAQVPAGLANVTAIAAGRFHSVALRADGSVACWGDNDSGQCNVPADLPPVAAIAAGFSHTAAVTRDGRVICWGNNADGQCTVPGELGGVTEIYAGNTRTVARTTEGQFVVWGRDAETLTAQLNEFGASASFTVGGSHLVAVNSPVDADFDGVDDTYERILGSNPESSDSDGDGLDDQTEVLAGFNPAKPSELPDGTVRILGALRLRFFTLGGNTYWLERSTDLVSWQHETALRPNAQFSDRNGYTDLLISQRNRNTQLWRLVEAPVAAP